MKIFRLRSKLMLSILAMLVFVLIFTSAVFAYTLLGLKWRTNQTGLDYDHLTTSWRSVCYYSRSTWNWARSNMYIYYDAYSQNDVAVNYYAVSWTGMTSISRYWLNGWYFAQADVYINTKYCDPTYRSYYPTSNRYDGQSTMTHELGHFVGLGHSYYPTTMYAYGSPGTTYKRDLHYDDILGIQAIYGVK